MTSDRILIKNLGGPAKVAKILGYDKNGGVQRVHNWMTRGIPARVKLQFPEVLLNLYEPDLCKPEQAAEVGR